MSITSSQLRQAFLDFFAKRGHEIVPSSSLVPANDPTLLFTNAGMVQFKDVLLGKETRRFRAPRPRRRCVRAGGKHNDLENVGYTARHHTFFEMLGNFSFGDYFKREAIHYAWDFVTGVLRLPPERLWCHGLRAGRRRGEHLARRHRRPTEPLCAARHVRQFLGDGRHGPMRTVQRDLLRSRPGSRWRPSRNDPTSGGDRYIEIWNLVFMQFERDASGTMTPLPKPSVDTGMGLERLAAVMQGVHSNYEIDLFRNLIKAAATATRTRDLTSSSLRVIADHIRACSFLIADGVVPGNEGRGYVLRRIIRRAIRHGYKLGQEEPFFYTLVRDLEAEMGAAYPELVKRRAHVERVLRQEEQRFAETLAQGMRLLEDAIRGLPANGVIPGETVFKLYDTYGFPEDLTADIARERGLSTDHVEFERQMDAQRERARGASKFGVAQGSVAVGVTVSGVGEAVLPPTKFLGYETLELEVPVSALLGADGQPVQTLAAGDSGTVVLERTPFYAESGGQVGDTGTLTNSAARFVVTDTQKLGAAFGHIGTLETGQLATGDLVRAAVDAERRAAIVLNHSATHLLHAALRVVLGDHVQQKGSLVAPDRLRFDFSHYEPVAPADLARIEALVNEQVRLNSDAHIRVVPYEEAIAAGALAFFGDKYGDRVRVLKIGDFSTELCGGTHVGRAGDIGLFKILSEGGIAAGVRRIEAVAGRGALDFVNANEALLKEVAGLVKSSRDDVGTKVAQLIERSRGLERELATLRRKLATGGGRDLLDDAQVVNGIKVVAARLDGADSKALRDAADQLKDRLGSGVVVLGAVEGEKVHLVAGVTKDLTGKLKAGDLIRPVAELVGGRGGGRADFAQAGGNKPEAVDQALALVAGLVSAAA